MGQESEKKLNKFGITLNIQYKNVELILKIALFMISFLFITKLKAIELNTSAVSELDSNPLQKFSLHNDTYFVLGDDDLKIQYSFKYRLANSVPFFFAYTQLMFWDVYEKSKPFKDVNYNPEMFYRFIDRKDTSFRTFDMGWSHLSNGKMNLDTRSIDRLFLRGNYLTTLNRSNLIFNLTTYYIYNEDITNRDIVNHLGYWDLSVLLFDVLILNNGRLGIEIRTYAGSKVFDLDQGALQIGLVYKFETKNFNPSIYLQRFEGFSESLINYNKRHTELRLGLNLNF